MCDKQLVRIGTFFFKEAGLDVLLGAQLIRGFMKTQKIGYAILLVVCPPLNCR